MFQNDFNFAFRDFEFPLSQSPEDAIAEVITAHDEESESCPYFFESEEAVLSKELPSSWSFKFDNSRELEEGSVRIMVHNIYDDATRSFDPDAGEVSLVVEKLGVGFCVIVDTMVDGESDWSLLELDGAFGESDIQILISNGKKTASFHIGDIDEAVLFIGKELC